MLIASIVLILSLIGTLGAWRPDIDINRVRLLPKENSHNKYPPRPSSPHNRRSIFTYNRNDYDDHSSGITELRPQMQFLPNLPTPSPKAIKVYQPKEDPRLFYLSDAYAKEINGKNLNNEVASVYPGAEVVRANGDFFYRYNKPFTAPLRERELNNIPEGFTPYDNICVKCPHDRTLVAKAGSDRVILPHVRIKSCSGLRLQRGVQYEHMHGAKFGSILSEGSYAIVGRITYKGKILKHCFMEVHVLTQLTCPMPKHLVAHCGDQNKMCNFSCRDPKAELQGSSNLTCGEDRKWTGHLPICKVKTWCESPPPPSYGRVSCKGTTTGAGSDLAEGSTCRVRCARGWKSISHSITVCRRGSWTHQLTCTRRRN